MNTQNPRAQAAPRRARSRRAPGLREEKRAIRREQVLDAALRLFCEHGYAGTSTRRVAEEAGVTEGLVFHYFESKEALLLELGARRHSFAGRVLTLVSEGRPSARDLLFEVAQGLTEVSAQEGAFIGFMLAEAQVNPVLRERMRVATEVVLAAFVAALAAAVEAGELRPDADLGAAAHGFFGGFLYFFSQHRHLGPVAWRRRAAAFGGAWAEQCWRGLANTNILSEHSKRSHLSRRHASP